MRRFLLAIVVAILLLTPVEPASPSLAGNASPNIVFILTDDMRWDFLRFMPHVRKELGEKGVTFSNAFVENPLCCPSRASILTGNDSHTTGVYTNEPLYGAWNTFHDRGEETSTIATWLHDAGYRTALVGKYLNDYAPEDLFVPPGWDRWTALGSIAYYDYNLNVDGSLEEHGSKPSDYSTDVFASDATDFIRTAPSGTPLFLYFAPVAPHGPATPAPRDEGTVTSQPSWPPSFNEGDVRDKPGYVRGQRLVSVQSESARYVRTEESLQAVDDAVDGIVSALRDTGRLANTMIVFTSDNGMLFGEHRMDGKMVPYEESIRVPLVVRWDQIQDAPRTDRHLVLNTDFAPTFADAAAASHPTTDGASFLPLLERTASTWRTAFLVEHRRVPQCCGMLPNPPSYCAVRTADHRLFVHYDSGFEEFYNLRRDPYELENRIQAANAQRTIKRLRAKDRGLCNPLPPGMRPF